MKTMSLIRVTYLGSGQKKLKENNPFTGAISLMAEGREGTAFELLFSLEADEQEIGRSIALFLDFLEAYHRDGRATEVVEEVGKYRPVGRLHLIFYDRAIGKLREQDPRG